MNGLVKKIELTANIAITVTAILLSVILVRHYLITGANKGSNIEVTSPNELNLKSEKVNLSNIDWHKNGKTLILALSTTCHFCMESSPFYERLTMETKNTHFVAVFPQSVEEGKQYLYRHGIQLDDVRQSALGDLGVEGTPTLILIDDKGTITGSWIGALSVSKEAEVISKLQ